MQNIKILVIAGNIKQFRLWCKEHDVDYKHSNPFVYCGQEESIRRYVFSGILYCGTGRQRTDVDIDRIRATSMADLYR